MKNLKIAALFPGQGSHSVGMSTDFAEQFSDSREVFDQFFLQAPQIHKILKNGSMEELTKTENQQPSLVVASLAAYKAFCASTYLRPISCAGHSLGEYSALVASESLELQDAINLTIRRGQLMSKSKNGKMFAVIGDVEKVKKACYESGAFVANYNAPTQTVISGETDKVLKAVEILSAEKLKCILLKVSAAFHCPLMQDTENNMQELLQKINFEQPLFDVYANLDAKIYQNDFADKLTKQITSSVRWVEIVHNMKKDGIEIFIEFGPGTVLTGLVKKIEPNVLTFNVKDLVSLESTLEALNNL